MIAFGILEIAVSVLVAVILGISFGLIYDIVKLIFTYLPHGIVENKRAFVYKIGIKRLYLSLKDGINNAKQPINHLLDFALTLCFGLIYLVAQFIVCDGIFRFYFVAFCVLGFLLGRLLYKKFVFGICSHAVLFFCAIVIYFVSLILAPIAKLTNRRKKMVIGGGDEP